MKLHHIKSLALVGLLGCGLTSCEDFLNRPTEDSYNVDNFYETAEQCYASVNPIYNSPWYDFQRFYFKAGEEFSGNLYEGNSPYMTFTVNSSDAYLGYASVALWTVNGYCNVTLNNINKVGAGVSDEVKLACKGECLVWKAMAYFFLVRTFGAVPIIHDSSQMIADKSYNKVKKAQITDVYDYIIMTLEQAIEWLPEKNIKGRIDKYSAKGLLAKVYLAKSGYGQSGQRNADDLAKAAQYAKDVIDKSGRMLMENYEDIFRLENNKCDESLIAWRWTAEGEVWTSQNTLQSDLAISGFDEFGDCWGGYMGVSVDLQDAFNEDALSLTRQNVDTRRKATMMMAGDKYSYFWKDKGGFDYIKFIYDTEGMGGPGAYQSPTGANCVKHLYGNGSDHLAATGISAGNMRNSLATHLLRLADVYLIYAEAMIGNNASTTDASAIDAFYQVRHRAIKSYERPSSITWEQVWKERRLELALECDRWYDYVRLSYYDSNRAINELKNQRRSTYSGLDPYYKSYYESGTATLNPNDQYYDKQPSQPNVTISSFTLPFPDTDMAMNPNLMPSVEPEHVDISQFTYK